MTRSMDEKSPLPLRSLLGALSLGLMALLVNQEWLLNVPIISEETPRFLFGGPFVLLAFVAFGWRLGLVAAVISLADNLVSMNPPQVVAAIYILEAAFAYAIFRRYGSLILGVTLFWVGPGWILDGLLYGGVLGLESQYLALLLVKQIFSGLLAAATVETVLAIPGLREGVQNLS